MSYDLCLRDSFNPVSLLLPYFNVSTWWRSRGGSWSVRTGQRNSWGSKLWPVPSWPLKSKESLLVLFTVSWGAPPAHAQSRTLASFFPRKSLPFKFSLNFFVFVTLDNFNRVFRWPGLFLILVSRGGTLSDLSRFPLVRQVLDQSVSPQWPISLGRGVAH